MPVRSVVHNAQVSRRAGEVTLSRYFPKNSCYFYGYPTGEASGFLNKVPPTVEELVSARPLVCAGDDVAVIAFANPLQPDCFAFLRRGNPDLFKSHERIISLPPALDANVEGRQRNLRIKQNLKRLVAPGTLVMAQPFLDEDVEHLYQIPPKLTNWLNDKQHMTSFVPAGLLPTQYAVYKNGAAFSQNGAKLKVPCVVKVSSSSAGDGVYVCQDRRSLTAAQKVLSNAQGSIMVEEFIATKANYGIQFGISHNQDVAIDIIGISEQLTTPEGEFIGGVIEPHHSYEQLEGLIAQMTDSILPQVRELGWYGVGCFDVLEDAAGKLYVIDGNFRMTGMTAYLMMAANRQVTSSLLSFNGEFHGSLARLEQVLAELPLAADVPNALRIIAIAEHDGVHRFNAALLFRDRKRVSTMARQLLRAGISSKALDQLSRV